MGSLSPVSAYSFLGRQVIEQAWLSQQYEIQAIARKLASANCSGSGKAVCI
jgi:ArsR family transcriptional regulator